ncbi:hypothetical protein [Demequina sp.]|uniref:hypothetical protein n=1 Tax=Demequina sp. TaxID=2050685 RepID=UPI003A854DBF
MKPSIAAGAVATLAALALTGCSYVNPITTKDNYAASDGVQAVTGEIEALNLLIIAEGADQPATLIGTLYNSSAEDIEVQISFDGATNTTVTVPARGDSRLGPDGDATEVAGTATVMPGLIAPTVLVTQEEGPITAQVPVMDGTLPEYQAVIDAIG